MSAADRGFSDADLDLLETYLFSDQSPPQSMLLSDLDGFLTGIAIGPELVMPSEWLAHVWGGEDPVFDDQAQASAILGAIMGRYNAILREIEAGVFEPLLWESADGTVIAADWAEGFMQAVALRPDAWAPLMRSKRHGVLLIPILALCGDENGEPLLELDPDEADCAMAEAAEFLPACVHGIAAYWRKRRPRAAGSGQPASAGPKPHKIGRNEPCPCGSGRKYKVCCGHTH